LPVVIFGLCLVLNVDIGEVNRNIVRDVIRYGMNDGNDKERYGNHGDDGDNVDSI
jgi:hypothetical protein